MNTVWLLNIKFKNGILANPGKLNLGKGIMPGEENAPLTPNILLNRNTVKPPANILMAIPTMNSSDFKSITNIANNNPTNNPIKPASSTPARDEVK